MESHRETLLNKASDYFPAFDRAASALSHLLALFTDEEDKAGLEWEIRLEVSFFGLHVIDRIMFEYLGPDSRTIFIDKLFETVREVEFERGKIDARWKDNKVYFEELWDRRQIYYSTCPRLLPDQKSPSDKNVCRAFAEMMSDNYPDMDVIAVTGIATEFASKCKQSLIGKVV